MPLTRDGQAIQSAQLDGQLYPALDDAGNRVAVSVSDEVIADRGWALVEQAASAKFDRGDFEVAGGNRRVRVTNEDCDIA